MNLTLWQMKTMTNKPEKRAIVLKKLLFVAVAVVTVILDRITKSAVVANFAKEWDSVTAIPGFLNFTYVLNDGAVAGILSDNRWVFMSVSVVAIAAITLYLFLSKDVGAGIGISAAMITGGGIGNMIDRVGSGEVIDFIDVTAVNFFPFNCVFNVADMFVCVGCALLIAFFIADEIKEAKAKKKKSEKNED